MPGFSETLETDDLSLPLVQPAAHRSAIVDGGDEYDDSQSLRPGRLYVGIHDRMQPAPSGGIAGFFAGAAALGVVQLMAPLALALPVHAAARQWGVSEDVSLAVAYVTAAAVGALIGGCFASVTRYLRRWLPLLFWALVFFASLALLLLALSSTYGKGTFAMPTPAIFGGIAAYAFVVSFSLPLRKRG